MFPPSCFTVGMVIWQCNSTFIFLHTQWVKFVQGNVALVSSDQMIFSQSSFGSSMISLANFRWAWRCTCLSRGTPLALQDLNPPLCSVILMVAFLPLASALCSSFIRSHIVVLRFFLTAFIIILTLAGWNLVWGPSSRAITSILLCFPFSYNCSHRWFIHINLLVVSHFPDWCRSKIFFLVSFDISMTRQYGPGCGWIWYLTVWGCGQMSFEHNEFKHVPLIWVMSLGKKSSVKK